jgi:hypothetical protein
MTYTSHEPTKHAHIDEYMYKNEKKWSSYQPLTPTQVVVDHPYCFFTCVASNDKNENQAPSESRIAVQL